MNYLDRITAPQLQKATGTTAELAALYFAPLMQVMINYNINTRQRVTVFTAQCACETGGFRKMSENLNYSAARLRAVFPGKFTEEEAKAYAWNPVKIANRVYGGRYGNRPEASGDGWKFRGRGMVHTTFFDNYRQASEDLDYDFIQDPDAMTKPGAAAYTAGAFWDRHDLNELADAGGFLKVSLKINGRNKATGLPNGWDDRKMYLSMAMEALPA